ncbi:MAG: transposase [Firmicutes bacterium]|nr:transposase [Bacillota bacterium]
MIYQVVEIVGNRYSPTKGTPARDPINMLRSLLIMELSHERSIDSWVNKMRSTSIFAILSGFFPNDIPGVGTFYDFIKRLWLASSAHLSSKLRKPRRKPKKGKKKRDKSPLKRPGAVKRLVDRCLKNPPVFHSRPHDIFQKIFKECFVVPSTKHGLLGDSNALSVAGDGSSARTGANCYGKLVCDCRNKVFYSNSPRYRFFQTSL